VPRLRDVLTDKPKILFVGINPGETSGKVGHHFAGPGNPFWRLLHAAGMTPVVLRADEDQRLAEFGYALTNICPRTTKTAAELSRDELARGAKQLRAKIKKLAPSVVALVGITIYPLVVPRLRGEALTPGPGPKPELVEGARLFVVPNPSGLNASFPTFDAKLAWFRQLALFAGVATPGDGKPSAIST
jgi:TDG/mug DNA glycosylase family protein